MGAHGVGVDLDLVLADEAADRGDLGDTPGLHQPIADVPVLDGAQLVQVPPAGRLAVRVAALQRVPEDLAKGRGVGPEGRLHAVG